MYALKEVTFSDLYLSCQLHRFFQYRYANGASSTYTCWNLNISDDLYARSDSGAKIRISFDIKHINVDAGAASTANVYTGIWIYYRYLDTDGTAFKSTGRGWYLRIADQYTFYQ